MTKAGLREAGTLIAALVLLGTAHPVLAPIDRAGRVLVWADEFERLPSAPFDQPFSLMASLAVGGRLSEDNKAKGVAPGSFPAQFAIDRIRVYQCASDPATGRACII